MITGLKIHTDNGKVQLADAPDDYICGDLLVDILQAVHPGASQHEWGLHNGDPEQLLSLGQTLYQSRVCSDNDLYLIPTKRVKGQYLELEITAPGGRTQACEAPSSIVTAAFLTMVINHFNLGGPADKWVLYDETGRHALDTSKTLAANDVATRDRLTIQKVHVQVLPLPPSDLVLHINAPNGRTHRLETPGDIHTSKLLGDLVIFFGLATQNRAEDPIHWVLVNEHTDKELNPSKSLAGEGIESGDRLLLRPVKEATERTITVTVPDGRKLDFEMPPDLTANEFLQDVVSSFSLRAVLNNRKPVTWLLFAAGSKGELNLHKTLADNRVLAGDQLLVRQLQTGWWANSQKWLLVTPFLLAAVAGTIWLTWPAKPVIVEINSSKPSASALETVAFTATVKHAKKSTVRWSVDPQIGSIAADGLYSAPSFVSQNQIIHVTATSQQDATRFSTAELKLLTVALSLSPTTTQLRPSESAQFSAVLRPDAGTSVHWALTPQIGTVTSTGEYRAPSYRSSPQTVILTATSEQLPHFSANATISLNSSPPLHMLPSATVLQASQSRQFTLRPNPGSPLHWQLRPSIGTVGPNGVYAAPTLIAQEQQIVISASAVGTGSSSTAIINLKPVSIGTITSSAGINRQILFHANVSNTSNPNILWSIEPQLGSISAQGVYTPPAEIESAKTITVKATSQADPSKLATYVVHVAPVVSLRFNSYNPLLVGKQRETFSVNVKGTSNKAVTWSSVGPGEIMPNGLYIPPSTIPLKGAPISIIATSNADPSRSVRAEITLHPAVAYVGAKTGTITWQGKLNKNQVVTIRSNVPDSGSIAGGLPGVPVQIQLNTKKCDLLTAPSEANSWTTIVIRAASSQKSISITWTVIPGS